MAGQDRVRTVNGRVKVAREEEPLLQAALGESVDNWHE